MQKSGSILTNIFDLDVSLQKGDTEVVSLTQRAESKLTKLPVSPPLLLSSQWVICCKTLSNDGMRTTHLERHLKTMHPALAAKPKAFFETKRQSLKQAKMDSSGAFRQQTSKVVEASYEIAMLIAKSKKSHNIGDTLIKPSVLRAAELVLGKDSANKLS